MNAAALSPDQVAGLGRLDLVARLVVEGFLVGLHRSPYHGFSVEFAEYRQYMPGEPVTNMDWRVFAKTDRLYTKVFAEETNLRATLLVDCSASMAFRSEAATVSKADYARLLAASLSYLLLHQNDAVGLELFDSKPLASVPARATRGHLFRLLAPLNKLPTGRATALGDMLHRQAERLPRRGLVMVFSDLMTDVDEVVSGLKHFRHRGHEVVVFQILDPREIDLDYRHDTRFEDLENPSESVRLHPAQVGSGYRERMEAWRQELRKKLRGQRVDLVELTTDMPFDRALLSYLTKRRRIG